MIFKCERLKEYVVLAAYRECNIFRYIQVVIHTRQCIDCRKVYEEHYKLASGLNKIQSVNCPDNVLKNVEKKIGMVEIVQPTFFSDLGGIISGITFRKLSAALMIIAAVSVGVIFYRQTQPLPVDTNNYSDAEISKASKEAKESLALLGEILNSTTTKLEKDVSEHVSRPLRKSIKLVNDLFEQENTK